MEYNIEIYAQREYIFLVALNKIKKSDRSEFKKKVLKMMIDYNLDQTDLARFEGVTPQAINNRLKRLNKDCIIKLFPIRELVKFAFTRLFSLFFSALTFLIDNRTMLRL